MGSYRHRVLDSSLGQAFLTITNYQRMFRNRQKLLERLSSHRLQLIEPEPPLKSNTMRLEKTLKAITATWCPPLVSSAINVCQRTPASLGLSSKRGLENSNTNLYQRVMLF